MSDDTIAIVQQTGTGSATQAAPSATPIAPSRAELREQIRQSIEDARAAAQDAAVTGKETRFTVNGKEIVIPARSMPGQPGFSIQGADMSDIIPPQAVDIAYAFFIMCAVMVIGWPLARAFGRRLERRANSPAMIDLAMAGQLQRIEQAVEAMSIEIERISESQRFMAKLQSGAPAERAALGVGERR